MEVASRRNVNLAYLKKMPYNGIEQHTYHKFGIVFLNIHMLFHYLFWYWVMNLLKKYIYLYSGTQ